MNNKFKEIKRRVYYGDLGKHLTEEHRFEIAFGRLKLQFGDLVWPYVEVEEITDEYGARCLEGKLTVVIPDTYKPKDFYIP